MTCCIEQIYFFLYPIMYVYTYILVVVLGEYSFSMEEQKLQVKYINQTPSKIKMIAWQISLATWIKMIQVKFSWNDLLAISISNSGSGSGSGSSTSSSSIYWSIICPADINVLLKESEKLHKYQPLARDSLYVTLLWFAVHIVCTCNISLNSIVVVGTWWECNHSQQSVTLGAPTDHHQYLNHLLQRSWGI